MKGITVLGSTGSIGASTLDVISRHPDRYKIVALAAQSSWTKLFEQCCQFLPDYAVLANANAAEQLERKIKQKALPTKVLFGCDAMADIVRLESVDIVMAAITGAAGLLPTLAAAKAGKCLLLANKESLVMSGKLLMDAVHENNATLLPIDSEHNAIFQCLPVQESGGPARNTGGIHKILLTASGGPFLNEAVEKLDAITPDQACAHPNWSMGRKISVDSATMMNKGLELIEACWLFDINVDDVDIVIHPQSIIHSMVSYADGSVLAQMGRPDMRTPIAHALGWPERIDSGVKPLNLFDVAKLTFEKPDPNRFPCLQLAYNAAKAGGTAAAILNAANEVAVEQFLLSNVSFTAIAKIVENTMKDVDITEGNSLDAVLSADKLARLAAHLWVDKFSQNKGIV